MLAAEDLRLAWLEGYRPKSPIDEGTFAIGNLSFDFLLLRRFDFLRSL